MPESFEVQPVNVISCLPGKCEDDVCPMSETAICCRDCGRPEHQKAIRDFVGTSREVSELIKKLTTEHTCKFACKIVAR